MTRKHEIPSPRPGVSHIVTSVCATGAARRRARLPQTLPRRVPLAPPQKPAASSAPAPTVGLISLGCAKNLVDTQTLAGFLLTAGFRLARRPEEADAVLVNTCAFVHDARREAWSMIRKACRLKASGSCRAVVVAGCLPQRERGRIKQAAPGVDAVVGPDELDRIPHVMTQALAGKQPAHRLTALPYRLFEPPLPGLVLTGGPYAYLKIADGCNHRCSFCTIPAIRGRYRSRPLSSVVQEAETLLVYGFRELNLVAQDTARYGSDSPHRSGSDLPALIRALGRLGGTFWIRVLYGHPAGVSDALLEAMAETPQVCRYLDIPIQHADPDILRAMGRADTIRSLPSLFPRIRHALPGVTLRTTCLVGFPGESEDHFQRLVDFIQEIAFDHLGVFVYSPEPGTAAAAFPNRPSRRTAEERRIRLLQVQRPIVTRRHRQWIGTTDTVLLERPTRGPQTGCWIARSERQAPEVDGTTRVRGVPADHKAGDFIRIRYTGHAGYDPRAVFLRDVPNNPFSGDSARPACFRTHRHA